MLGVTNRGKYLLEGAAGAVSRLRSSQIARHIRCWCREWEMRSGGVGAPGSQLENFALATPDGSRLDSKHEHETKRDQPKKRMMKMQGPPPHSISTSPPGLLTPGPRFLAIDLLALPPAVVALSSTGITQQVSGLFAVLW